MIEHRQPGRTAAAVAVWTLLVAGAWLLGLYKEAITEQSMKLHALPLFGHWVWDPGPRLLLPIAVGAFLIAVLPAIAARWRWRWTVLATSAAGVAFSLALAAAHSHPDTWHDINLHYGDPIHYVDDAGPAAFLRGYTDRQVIGALPIHMQSHPPGLVLTLWAAARVGLAGPGFENSLAMLGAAAAIASALAIARDVAGERPARRAAPFLVITPGAFWHTTADIIFGGVTLAAVACLILATGRRGRRAAALTAVGGLLAGAAMMMSFSAVLLALPLLAVAAVRGRWWVLAGGGALAAAVVFAPLAWGYWWLDGLSATRVRYYEGVAAVRGYWYFLLANLAVFAFALGPAIAVGLARLRDKGMWIVVGATLAAVAIADLSGMSSAETERIWQPFMPLVLLAGCAVPMARAWLSAHLALAVLLAASLYVAW